VEQGGSVAVSGDGNIAVVGGPYDNGGAGAAWVFIRIGGLWFQQGAKLKGAGAEGLARQGDVALSADGNTMVVGGPGDNGEAGAAWVFIRIGGVWVQQGPKLVGKGAVVPASQGISVALSADGNTAVVGGPDDDSQAGAAWVFIRIGGVWIQQGDKLVGTGAVGAARQGVSVSVSGDGNTALLGGLNDNDQVGAAWVFTRIGGVWIQQGDKLVGADAVGAALQGISVALSGDGNTAVVGGYADNAQAGAAWVYTRSAGVWSQQGAKFVGTGASGFTQQGCSVAVSADGNTALVGGRGDNAGAGATWVYTRSGGVWSQQGDKLVGTDAAGPAEQGNSVAVSADGSTAVVGGYNDDNYLGAAWVFANTGPRPTVASFFMDRRGDTPLRPPIFVGASKGPQPTMACADGADAELVILDFPSVSNIAAVRFRIKENPAADSAEVYGQFTTETIYSAVRVGCRYVHPSRPVPISKSMTIEAFDLGTGNVLFSCPMLIYNPPVLFVHGLWGEPSGFNDMMSAVKTSGGYLPETVFPVDYSWSAARDFSFNSDVVPSQINSYLNVLNAGGIAAAKVDLVTHSMGGILSRRYLQSSSYRGDINRLVTIDTPHWGSQAANLLRDTSKPYHSVVTWGLIKANMPPDLGAVDDLCVDSPAITFGTNGPSLNQRIVPSHAIACDVSADQSNAGLAWVYGVIAQPQCTSAQVVSDRLFNEQADLVVPSSSQWADLPVGAKFFVANQGHMGAQANPTVIANVITVLHAAASDPGWTTEGFGYRQLAYNFPNDLGLCPKPGPSSGRPRAAATATPSVSIISPPNGSTVSAGDTVSITAQGSADVAHLLFLGGCSTSSTSGRVEASTGVFRMPVPSTALGSLGITVAAFSESGAEADASIELAVTTSASLDSITCLPTGLDLPVGARTGLDPVGNFSDGVQRSLLSMPGVSISSSAPTVVAARIDSIVAIGVGSAALTIGYQGMTFTVPVVVSGSAIVGVLDPPRPGGASNRLMLSASPNPSAGGVEFRFFAEASLDDVQLDVFDAAGRRLWAIHPGPGSGARNAKWDGTERGGQQLRAGVYFARLRVGRKTTQTRFVLLPQR
jgi:hypothetical protein